MGDIKIHILHTGKVCVSPHLPFGGEHCGPLKASGVFERKSERLWLPVSVYLIEHPRGLVLVDTGWGRSMSPEGKLDKRAQIASLGSRLLYQVNQGIVGPGETAVEQLEALGVAPTDLDYVLLTHLDCDHANGLSELRDAQSILVAADELNSVKRTPKSRIRYQSQWWENVPLAPFEWNCEAGPFNQAYDLFGDGSVMLIAIPGHADGLFAVKVTGIDGRFSLLASDGAYGRRSWEEMVLPGIANNRADQRRSLTWIREQNFDPLCVGVIFNHDPEIIPQVIELP